jgi:hypothetical protein
MTAKYAPANDEGLKPYVVTRKGWRSESTKVVYADTPTIAKFLAFGRMGVGQYVSECRRATPGDIEH